MTEEDTVHAARIIEEIKHELAVLKLGTEGWVEVDHPGYKSRYDAIDVEMWVCDNCGDFRKMGRTFFFREEKDALIFIMKYL